MEDGMSLHIVVCIKPVPDPDHYDRVTIAPDTKRIVREGIPTVINAVDKCALEKALQLRAQYGGKVTVITMSLPSADTNLREALAMGADEGILLTDRAFAGADTLATSYTLAKAISQLGDADLVMLGAESADGATGQVPSQLGEWLKMPHLWNVFSIEDVEEKKYRLKTKYENGYKEWEGTLPLVLGVSRELAKPRHIGAMGIIKAKNKPITVLGKNDICGIEDEYIGLSGSPTQAGEIRTPEMGRSGHKLEGTTEEIGIQILEKIRAGGITI
jgi:electron transfer flavoprotein beta subunit